MIKDKKMNQKSVCFYLSKEFEAVGLADLLQVSIFR